MKNKINKNKIIKDKVIKNKAPKNKAPKNKKQVGPQTPVLPQTPYGIIGGSVPYGLDQYDREDLSLETPYGRIEACLISYGGLEVVFIPRHSRGFQCPPHQTNHRGIVEACQLLGVEYLMSTHAVSSVNPDLEPGSLTLLDDFVDFTKNRLYTFHQDGENLAHVNMDEPYCRHLTEKVRSQALANDLPLRAGAVYVGMEGPRRETRAEAHFYEKMGWDVVGLTEIPEVILAKEKGICYLSLGLVNDWASHPDPQKARLEEDQLNALRRSILRLFLDTYKNQSLDHDHCLCQLALDPRSPY